MGRSPSCDCGECKKCKTREYNRKYMKEWTKGKRRGYKHKPPKKVLQEVFEKEIEKVVEPDEIKEKEEKVVEETTRRIRGTLERIMVVNRVGIPIIVETYKDGRNAVIVVSLGDINKPEEPILYFDLKKLEKRVFKPGGMGR